MLITKHADALAWGSAPAVAFRKRPLHVGEEMRCFPRTLASSGRPEAEQPCLRAGRRAGSFGSSVNTVLAFSLAGVPSEYKDRGGYDSDPGERKVCRFKLEWLGNCSGINDESFGYKEGKPCIIIKLNRVLGFKPKASRFSALELGPVPTLGVGHLPGVSEGMRELQAPRRGPLQPSVEEHHNLCAPLDFS